ELMALVLPPLRADLRMIESYTCPLRTPIATPISVLGGTEDKSVPPHRLEEWQDWTVGGFSAQWFPGGHFFLYPAARRGPTGDGTMPLPFRAVLDSLPPAEGP